MTQYEGYDVKTCTAADFQDTICDCLCDVMVSEADEKPGCIVVPTNLNLRYSEKGGLGLAIAGFYVAVPSFENPPKREEAVKIIREAYETMVQSIAALPLRIGEIREIPIIPETEYNLEIELHHLQ
ncbi:MAG TPA: hypothetical protein VK254_03045 [Candidatus Bathyarchaeia archaeon]|nr:hypothetical protein [Candidatus Bathyarchaeia archaeon]